MLWIELQLDQFWSKRLGVSRKGTHWDQVLFVLVAYRLLAPGSEWRLHREWFQRSALADLLGEDSGLAEVHKLCRRARTPRLHRSNQFRHRLSPGGRRIRTLGLRKIGGAFEIASAMHFRSAMLSNRVRCTQVVCASMLRSKCSTRWRVPDYGSLAEPLPIHAPDQARLRRAT